MKRLLLVFLLFIFSFLYADRYIVEFKGRLPEKKAKGFIKTIEKYSLFVIEGEYNSLKEEYPDAVRIFKDPKVKALYTPNDAYFSYQWSLTAEHYNISYILDRGIYGSRSIIIGILDTGVSFEDYPIPANEIDLVVSSDGDYHKYQDFEGITFVDGYDFVSDDSHPNDMNGHGTAVTSVIAAVINNNYYLSGIIYDAAIMPLRVLDESGEGNLSDILLAIDYGVSHGCKVLNLSLGGAAGDSSGWDILHTAITDARNNGVAVVCASGNEGVSELSYPAGFEEAIAVGAVDFYFDRTYYSQYGDNLDFMAPGGVVYQDINGDGEDEGGILLPMPEQTDQGTNVSEFAFYFMEGTSFSVPHLSALLGLLFSVGYSDIDEILPLLIDKSVDLGSSGYDNEYGWGYPKPESLFTQPFIIKMVSSDIAKNGFIFSAMILNDSVVLDSLVLSSFSGREKLNYNISNSILTSDISVKKSGIYSIKLFAEKAGEDVSFSRDIAVRSLLDNSFIVYNGNIEMFSDSPFLLLLSEKGLLLTADSKSLIKIKIKSKNNEHKSVYNNDKKAYYTTSSDAIEFSAQKKGFYHIEENSALKNNIEEKFLRKTVFLKSDTLIFESDSYSLLDKTGRIIKNENSGTVDFKNVPSGIYFVKSGNMLWKILKTF